MENCRQKFIFQKRKIQNSVLKNEHWQTVLGMKNSVLSARFPAKKVHQSKRSNKLFACLFQKFRHHFRGNFHPKTTSIRSNGRWFSGRFSSKKLHKTYRFALDKSQILMLVVRGFHQAFEQIRQLQGRMVLSCGDI